MWDSYKRDFNKQYESSVEEQTRFKHFFANMKVADERNRMEQLNNGTAVHGVTRFSDLSQQEFESRYLRTLPSAETLKLPISEFNGDPSSTLGLIDWTGKYTTAVKDQGYCGSCWAFSATEQIESDSMRTLGVTYLLSPEQITQCDTTSGGCNGGWPSNAYNYVKKAGGIETDANYPYTSYNGVTGSCKADSSKFTTVTVTASYQISGEANMASYVQTKGPLSICIDASAWNSYKSGIVTSCGTSIDHAVQVVGVDTASGGYWKVRNSWGTGWGEAGYIRLSYGKNTCGISYAPTYTAVSKK